MLFREDQKDIYIYFNSSVQYFIHCCLVVGNGCEKLLSTITADRGPCFSMEICGSHKSTTHHPHCGWWLGKNMRNLSCCKFLWIEIAWLCFEILYKFTSIFVRFWIYSPGTIWSGIFVFLVGQFQYALLVYYTNSM